eukprot:2783379-Amphidinium_carterae.1
MLATCLRQVASSIFWEDYISEPLCSDELLPLLALALPDEIVTDDIASTIKGHRATAPTRSPLCKAKKGNAN